MRLRNKSVSYPVLLESNDIDLSKLPMFKQSGLSEKFEKLNKILNDMNKDNMNFIVIDSLCTKTN